MGATPFRPLSRRSFLLGGTAAVTLAACGSDGSVPADGSGVAEGADLSAPVTLGPSGPPIPDQQRFLGARFPDGIRSPSGFVAGQEARLPFVAIDRDQLPLTGDAPDEVRVAVQRNGVVVHEQVVAAQAKDEFTPYYPVVFMPAEPGEYAVVSDYGDVPTWFGVVTAEQLASPQVGQPLPPFATPTFDDLAGVELLCTRSPEPCPFHDITLEAALGLDKPVAFLIATPLFCQTDVCGPSVDYLVELAPEFPDVTILHSEVWAEDINAAAGNPALAPVVAAYQMAWEPALFVTDATGTIVHALHWAMSRAEVANALSVSA